MDAVFTLIKQVDGRQIYITSSQNFFDIVDAMYDEDYLEINDFNIYVTEYGRNNIPYKEWRNK